MLRVDILFGIGDIGAIPALIAIDQNRLTVIAVDAHRSASKIDRACVEAGFGLIKEMLKRR
jgi:hypothetical protein